MAVATALPSAHARPPGTRAGLGYMPALDGIRGLSVIAVVAFHLGRFPGGYLGVDAFFVLSGFLITGLVLGEHDRVGRIDLARFYVRRARRLVPALLVFVLAVCVWARGWAVPGQLDGLRGEAMAALFYVANWHAIAGADSYWDLDAAPSPFDHMWSLAIEEQFYLLWPFVVVAACRLSGRSTRFIGPLATVLAAASGVAMVAQYQGGDPNSVYMGTHSRAQAILIGAALAWLLLRRGLDRPVPTGVGRAALAAVPVLGWMWWRVDGASEWLYRGGFTIHAALVALVIAAVASNRGALAQALSLEPWRSAGLISYGLYLYHWPIIVWFTPERTGWNGASLDLFRVVLALSVSIASYRLIERPIRFGSWPTPRRVAIAVPAALVVVAILAAWATRAPAIGLERLEGISIPTVPSPPAAGPDVSTPVPSSVEQAEPVRPEESVPTPTTVALAPVTLAPGEIERVVYVGDSIGAQVSPYLDRVFGDEVDYLGLTQAGSALCDFFPDLEAMVADPPDVLIIDHGGNALSPCMFDDAGQPVTGDAYYDRYRVHTARTIDLARQMGARLLLVDQPVSRTNAVSGTGDVFRAAADADISGTVRAFSTWPAISPDGVFVQTAPCAEWEPGCVDGEGEVRSPPPGVHLEPLGQWRYALAIRDDLALAGWLPSAFDPD